MITLTKTYNTRDGRKARILCVDWKDVAGKRVVALLNNRVTGTEELVTYDATGRMKDETSFESEEDLIEQTHIPEMPRATPEHCIRIPAGYDTTVGDLISSGEAKSEAIDSLERTIKELREEKQQFTSVLEAIQTYLPKQSTPYLLAKAALEGEMLS